MTSQELREWQIDMGYTYEEAAAALGISRATYSRYVNGSNIPIVVGMACHYLCSQQDARDFLSDFS
jgi:transcriptional regulator with XRE-family HTH domain